MKSKIIILIGCILMILPNVLLARNNKWAAYFKKQYITAYAEVNGNHWLGTKCGLIHYNSKTKQTNYYFTNSDTTNSKYDFKQILIENPNSIWVILQNNGITHFQDSEWYIYNQTNTILKSNEMIKAAIAPSGRKWFITRNAIYSLNNQKWEEYTKGNTSILQFPLLDVAIDQLDKVWFSGGRSIFRFADGIWSKHDGPSSNIYITADDVVWLHSKSSFYKIENNTLKKIKTDFSELTYSILYLSDFIIDENNTIWAIQTIGEEEEEMDLICIKDGKATIKSVFNYTWPIQLYQNSSKEVFLYTSKGLYKYKNEKRSYINYIKENIPKGITDEGQYKDIQYSYHKGEGNLVNYQEEGHWIYKNKNVQIIMEGDFISGKKVGTWTTYFDNGSVERITEYKDGIKDGHYVEHYKNGVVKIVAEYENNLKEGIWLKYNSENKLQEKGEYKNNTKVGIWFESFNNGCYVEIDYVNGKSVGEWNYFNPDGKPIYTEEFPTVIKQPNKLNENGNKQGLWITFMDNRFKSLDSMEDAFYYRNAEYDDGVPQGFVRDYFMNGILQFEGKMISEFPSVYADGKIKIYGYKGNLKTEREYINGTKNGIEQTWKNDVLLSMGNYKNNLKEGYWMEIIRSTSIVKNIVERRREVETLINSKHEGKYIKGRREGIWKVYAKEKQVGIRYYEKGTYLKPVNLQKINPGNFLQILKSSEMKPVLVFPISSSNWKLKQFLELLMNKIESEKECAPVVSTESTDWPVGKMSTIGREAMYMLQGFIDGKYPPTECSVTDFNPKVKYYKKWWQKYQNDLGKE